MKEKNTGFFWFLRMLALWLIIISLFVFVVTASLSSLFGHSLWSWVNVLRFVLGGAIIFLLICYGFFFKMILKGGKAK